MEEKELFTNISVDKEVAESSENSNYPFSDVKYIYQSTTLIVDSVQKGFDVTQLPNGDIMVTEVRLVNVRYSWDPEKHKFVKAGQG